MLDIEPELDRQLRAMYDHIATQVPQANLARITRPALRSGRKALGRVAGVVGIAVVAAGIVVFATELHAHRVSTPTPAKHSVSPPSPVWSPSPLPSPNPRLALPSLPNPGTLPVLAPVLVPETQGMGDASVTVIPDGELYIQYACVGDSPLVVTATDVLGPEVRPGCSSSAADAAIVATSLPSYPNQVLKAADLGKPVTIEISTAPTTTWEIFIAESRPPVPPSVASQGLIAASANPWTYHGGENGDIYLLSPGASPRRVIGSDGDGIAQDCPAFSPDGQRLAYGEARASGAVTSFRGVWPVSDRAVVVVALSDPSKPLIRLTLPTAPGEIACPQWSPDGRHVAYRVGADLWVADTTSGKTTLFQVLATPWGQNGFAWSRDGKRIAVAEPGQIRVVPIDGSTATVIAVNGDAPGDVPGSMGWTADDGIIYASRDPVSNLLVVNRVDANGSNDTQLASGGGDLVSTVSPDGNRVAYIDSSQHVVTMDTRGGRVVEVPVPSNFLVSGLLWSPDGKRLLLSSIDGVVSVAVAPGSPPLAYTDGQYNSGLNLEWTFAEVTWQPATGQKR
jgi:Tol biopolymer transport system component